MARSARYHVPFKRRKQGRTNYRHRLNLIKSRKPRVVVRKSNKNIIVQVVDFDPKGDKVLASALSSELKKFGWDGSHANLPGAYLTGYLAGKRAAKAKVKHGVLDIGLNTPTTGAKVFSALKGLVDAGLDIPHSEEILPDEERIKGTHINEKIPGLFDTVKSKLEAS